MGVTVKSLGIDQLALEEKLNLVEEIWEGIATKDEALPITAAQRTELELRMAEDDADPDNAESWEDVRAQILSQLPD